MSEALGFVGAMGGWGSLVSLGMNILGGFSARRKQKRRERRMKRAIRSNIGRLKSQKGPVDTYYNSLDELLIKDTEVNVDRNIEDFSNNALAFNIKADKAVESGKGLVSGTVQKDIDVTRNLISKQSSNSLDDVFANQERTQMQLDEGRRKEMLAIDDAIAQLNMQMASI